MSLFKKPKIVKFEQNLCGANVNDNEVLFVRVADVVDHKKNLVEVPITHTAFIVIGGGDYRFCDSGVYPVFVNKEQIKKWKAGVTVEVIYMPKETSVVIRWGTKDKLVFRDSLSHKVVEVGASGQFGINITNHEQFLRKVVGARKEFDLEDFINRFGAAVVDEYANAFLSVVDEEKLSYDKFDLNRKKISARVEDYLSNKFADSWGICLVDFIIEAFAISAEDKQKVESVYIKAENELKEMKLESKIEQYLAKIERLQDKEWEKEKFLLQLEKEDKLAYYEVLKVIGAKKEAPKGSNFCPKCGHSCEITVDFCSNCGYRFAAATKKCPSCSTLNAGNATFCVKCGKEIK